MHEVAKTKGLGREVKGCNECLWKGVRQIIAPEGLIAKSYQNEELKASLLSTKDDILAERAPRTVFGQ